jgi:hypothetical protein
VSTRLFDWPGPLDVDDMTIPRSETVTHIADISLPRRRPARETVHATLSRRLADCAATSAAVYRLPDPVRQDVIA